MLQTKLKFLKNAIYKMKRSYGLPVSLHKIDQHTVDPETGEKTTVLGVIHINKAIILRAREFRSFVYDLAYISANKDFTAGGFFDPEDRRAFIDKRDLNGYVPTLDDYLIFQNEKWDIIEIQEFENDIAFGFLLRKIRGADIVRIERTHTALNLTQESSSITKNLLDRDVTSSLTLIQNLKEVP